jgi:hypothetical protein
MILKNRPFTLLSLLALSLLLMSWGYNGHRIINGSASLSYTPEMEQFHAWAQDLIEHASDADYRKDIDPNEGPRHYIDIDNYPEFTSLGWIPQNYDSVIARYGLAFVIDQGVLPWATKITYDSLVDAFTRFDWQKAVLFAADLGHYVGDACNPLHITRNYDGQFTGNNGIHSRYETGMINAFQSEITMTGDSIAYITGVSDYIFSYIYENYIYADSIMAADDYAQAVAGNTSSYAYKEALWLKCKGFTVSLFNRAANTLAKLMYSAWVDAGKPDMNSGPGIFELNRGNDDLQLRICPNPVNNKATISFELPEDADIMLQVFDANGFTGKILFNKKLPAGAHEYSFITTNLPAGIYFISLKTGKSSGILKIIKTGEH